MKYLPIPITIALMLQIISFPVFGAGPNLSGVKYQELFNQILNKDYIRLSRPQTGRDYVPYIMFSSVIQGYSDLCRSYLPQNAVSVEIYDDAYVGTEYFGFTQTDYYRRYLARVVHMKPEYEAVYRQTVLRFLQKTYEAWRREPGDLNIVEFYFYTSSQVIKLALDYRQFISNNGCESRYTTDFIDNLYNFVTDNWTTRSGNDYQYIENVKTAHFGRFVERIYANVPADFSPILPDLVGDEAEVTIILDERGQRQGLRWIVSNRLTWQHFEDVPSMHGVRINNFFQNLPDYIQAALEANKYYVVSCSYVVGAGMMSSVLYWHGKGPRPPESVRAFAKGVIEDPINACPVAYSGHG